MSEPILYGVNPQNGQEMLTKNIIITGQNFFNLISVTMDGYSITSSFNIIHNTLITGIMPVKNAGNYNIVITMNNGSISFNFTYCLVSKQPYSDI
jgi:hypothetical protein